MRAEYLLGLHTRGGGAGRKQGQVEGGPGTAARIRVPARPAGALGSARPHDGAVVAEWLGLCCAPAWSALGGPEQLSAEGADSGALLLRAPPAAGTAPVGVWAAHSAHLPGPRESRGGRACPRSQQVFRGCC